MKQMLVDEDEDNPNGLEEIDSIKEQRLAHQRRIDEECEISDNYQSMRRGAI